LIDQLRLSRDFGYPDFLYQRDHDSYMIVEVKGNDMINGLAEVATKDVAHHDEVEKGLSNKVIKRSLAEAREFRPLI
jgi:type III restriction enzyme